MTSCLIALPWDSNFFGLRVGSLNADNLSLSEWSKLLAGADFDLIYLFRKIISDGDRQVIQELGGVPVGSHVNLISHFENGGHCDEVVAVDRIDNDIMDLAYLSGGLSRFNRDSRLKQFFRPMYNAWLTKEIVGGKVFAWPFGSNYKGIATVSIKDGVGKIGLVAVSELVRRHGVGHKLMSTVYGWLAKHGVHVCEVVTQGDNDAALAFYRDFGFEIVSCTEIYHVWRSK